MVQRIEHEAAALVSCYRGEGFDFTSVWPVPSQLDLETAYKLATEGQATWEGLAGAGTIDAEQVAARKQRLLASLTVGQETRTMLVRHVQARPCSM